MKLHCLVNHRYFLIFTMVFFCYKTSYGQNLNENVDYTEANKNSIHATIGFVGLAGAYSINYERMLMGINKGTLAGLWSKVSFGGWGVWSSGGPYQSMTLGILTGANKSHLELNAGGARMFNKIGYEREQYISTHLSEPQPFKSGYVNVRLVGSAGYRYQQPGGKFMFRCGIGYPETIFVGSGLAF